MKININKLISQRSNYSRRQAENLVRQGLVSTKERIIQLRRRIQSSRRNLC